MKKTCNAILALILLLTIFTAPINALAVSASPTRIVNVVYDDSGSMYHTDGAYVDTWCQAKYSMEVFAAMLGESDTMNVYYMSDYQSGTTARPRVVLNGSDGAEVNVSKLHSETTQAGNTPFNSVRKAYKDLANSTADEKWLVILTDGEFEDGRMSQNEIDSFLAQKNGDVKVMFLGMGSHAAGITNAPNSDIFYEEAKTNNQILNKITEICTRIFNSNKLEVGVSSKTTSFDVPMSELTVFAQGANVVVNGIKNESGTLIKSSKSPVAVKYSDCDATNYQNSPATGLVGSIATFKDDFSAGTYTLDVTGAETIEIYYKPNVEVAAYLTDREGKEVADLSDLAAGEYTISFGFVKAGTQEVVAQSKLLGAVSYQATVTNNEIQHEKTYSDGDKIVLEEGDLDIDVIANYLEYNSVSTSLHYSIYKNKDISFQLKNNPTFTIASEGIENKDCIEIESKIDGNPISEEQWSLMTIPLITLVDASRDFKIDTPRIEKTEKPGIYKIYPVLPGDKPSTGTYEDCDYEISYSQAFGSETWAGQLASTIKMNDTRSWWERNWDLFVKLVILLAVLFVLAGYLPFIKHYLPKTLKKKPFIKCIPSEPGEKRKERSGTVEKNLLSTIIPYVPQTGTIKYVPKGVTGAPALTVRAIKRRRMTVTNIKAFAGKDYITFDGEAIKKDCKKFETGAGVCIKVKRGEWTYICTPNQAN